MVAVKFHPSPAATSEGYDENFAWNQPVSASSVRNNSDEFAGDMAVNGDEKTYWETADGTTKATLEVDMDGPTEINSVVIEEAAGMMGRVQEYKVEGLVNSNWKLLSQGTTIGERKVDRFPNTTIWKARLTILNATDSPAISEFGLYLNRNER